MGQTVTDQPTGLTEAHLNDPLTRVLGLPTDLPVGHDLPDPGGAGRFLQAVATATERMDAARREVETLVAKRAPMLGRAGAPHAGVPGQLRTEASERFDRIGKVLATLKSNGEDWAGDLAKPDLTPGKRDGINIAVETAMREVPRQVEAIDGVKPDIERKLGTAVEDAKEAYLAFLHAPPAPVRPLPEETAPETDPLPESSSPPPETVPETSSEPDPAPKPDYPSNEAGFALRDLDRYDAALSAARAEVAKAISEAEERLTLAGAPHDAVPGEIRTQAARGFDAIAEELASQRETLADMAKQLARRPGAEAIEMLESASGMAANNARKASQRTDPQKAELLTALAQKVEAAKSAYAAYERRRDEAREAFNTLAGVVYTGIVELQDWDVQPQADSFDARLKELRKAAPNDYFDAKDKLETLRDELSRAKITHTMTYADRMKELNSAINLMDGVLKTLASVVDEKVAQEFRTRADIVREMGTSGRNLQSLNAAIKAYSELQADVRDLLTTRPEGMQAIKDKQKAIRDKLGESKFKELRPKDNAAMQKLADDLNGKWFRMKASEALSAYTELESKIVTGGAWTSYHSRGETQRVWSKGTIARKLKDAKTAVDALNAVARKDPSSGSRKYEGELRKAVDALPEQIASEQSQESMAALNRRADEITALAQRYASLEPADFANKTVLAEAFHRDQAAGVSEREGNEQAIRDFKTAHAELLRQYNSCSGEDAVKADKSEYKAIKSQMDSAMTTATKTKDPETATAMLERAADRLKTLRAGGPEIRRGELAKIHTAYVEAVGIFDGKCDELIRKVWADAEGTDYEGAEAELAEALGPARAFLRGISFASEADVLKTTETSGKAARKRAREAVLTKVRQATAALTGNVAVKMAVANPFGISALATSLHKTLREIELEVLRGV